MPADEEELDLALADGVEFCELLAPKALNGAVLTCDVMELGEPDASGRRSPSPRARPSSFRHHGDLRRGRGHRCQPVRCCGR
ncbi:MAG: hypothetical protein ACLU0O_09265 [Collinsella sp.]